ncbi:MAG TPA: cytidylate kinase-like family protein [Polyangiaceae bacterium]|jgi:cytidylate kinase|nr:cytidylate kinase-like family protein [Polyangiaceae bacterium]
MRPSQVPRHVDAIVEEQVRRWELQRNARLREQQKKAEEPWPIITVSREFGSQGAGVGQIVADRLGFSFWHQELVHEVAQRTGAREALIASLDEHLRSRLDEFIAHIFTGVEATAAEYVRQVGQVVHTLDRHGGAVIIGRGAQFIVSPERALRVRVICAHELRVQGYAERQGVNASDARRKIDDVDRERRAFYRKHYDRAVEEPTHYDLIVNTGTLRPELAADVVMGAYRAKFGRLPVL